MTTCVIDIAQDCVSLGSEKKFCVYRSIREISEDCEKFIFTDVFLKSKVGGDGEEGSSAGQKFNTLVLDFFVFNLCVSYM